MERSMLQMPSCFSTPLPQRQHPGVLCDATSFRSWMLGRQLAQSTVKQPHRLPVAKSPLHLVLRNRQTQQCSGGSSHNSVSFLLLCLASCYAKIGRGGQWSVATERHTPTRSNRAGNSWETHKLRTVPTRGVALEGTLGWLNLQGCRRPCKPKKKRKANSFSLPSFLSLPPPSLSLSPSYCYWDHTFTSSCKRHSYVY